MDFNQACLNLKINCPFSHLELKKQYRLMALKYHPDKHNPDIDGFYTAKFAQINESYEYLNDFLNASEDKNNTINIDTDYNSLFSHFLSSVFINIPSDIKDDIQKIILSVITDCHNLSIKLFENMDKERAIKVFEFINTYHHILYISSKTVEKIRNIINKKIENDNIIILNPLLTDLMEDNIYILELENKKYYVPLWHDEIYYKHNDNDLVVKCLPDLPENISLDNNNNIVVEIDYFISNLLNQEHIEYKLGSTMFYIPIKELKIQKIQKYLFNKKGISLIQQNDIYNNTEKSNVIFIIHLS